jgi:CheY-like chemotaxis protein
MTDPREVSVLVVDDDADIRLTLEDVLVAEGFSVALAANGAEALRVLTGARPRVILLDLSMPVMDGEQFRERQRSDATLAAIPIVVMTAADRTREKIAPMNADGFLAKPVQLDDLLAIVSRYAR